MNKFNPFVTKQGDRINPLTTLGKVIWKREDGRVVGKEIITHKSTREKTVFLIELDEPKKQPWFSFL